MHFYHGLISRHVICLFSKLGKLYAAMKRARFRFIATGFQIMICYNCGIFVVALCSDGENQWCH